ncbi:MAG: hypothetical protein JSU01_05540, partial [Bacteroidetes bacterium]|nr:hypothetical protein [Bacteroidota bacterium]
MSWIHFLLWVLGVYFLYYLAMILWDLGRQKTQGSLKQNGTELTFTESAPPKLAADFVDASNEGHTGQPSAGNNPDLVLPEVIASGGVLLR